MATTTIGVKLDDDLRNRLKDAITTYKQDFLAGLKDKQPALAGAK